MSETYDAAVEIREALLAVATQFEELGTVAERVDALTAVTTRIADALEELVKQHHAASSAEHGPRFHTLLSEQEPT